MFVLSLTLTKYCLCSLTFLFNYFIIALHFSVFNVNLFSDGNASTLLPCNEYHNINWANM